jgi:hypothetical protein
MIKLGSVFLMLTGSLAILAGFYVGIGSGMEVDGQPMFANAGMRY